MPAHARPQYRGDYQRRARAIRDAANANPNTTCWRCGLVLSAHANHRNGRPPTWHAGHIIDSDPNSPLAPEASTCNTAAGAVYGNQKREPTSYNW